MNVSTWIWIGVVVVVVGYLIYSGALRRLSAYVQETREELKKCNWPTWNELKGSTVVVIISVGLLGAFTFAVDYMFAVVIRWIT